MIGRHIHHLKSLLQLKSFGVKILSMCIQNHQHLPPVSSPLSCIKSDAGVCTKGSVLQRLQAFLLCYESKFAIFICFTHAFIYCTTAKTNRFVLTLLNCAFHFSLLALPCARMCAAEAMCLYFQLVLLCVSVCLPLSPYTISQALVFG